MEDFFRRLKESVSIDNIVHFMKEAKLIDDKKLKEEDVRGTLQKMDPSDFANVDQITAKLSNIAEQSKVGNEDATSRSDNVTKGSSSVLQKPTDPRELTEEEEMARHEEIIAFNS